jgi:2-C-methyl-D-erythritol 4-phosphate cytidylyltransferase
MSFPSFLALIPAAGVGARMGSQTPKQYAPLAGKPMLQHVIDAFTSAPEIEHTYVVVSAGDGYIDALALPPCCTILRCGGDTRADSVTNGLAAMAAQVDADDWVLVHDAARPGLTAELIAKLIAFVKDDAVGGLLALPVVDTIKRSDGHSHVADTVSREHLWAAQTPQMFRHGALLSALREAARNGVSITDEASAIESAGLQPKLVEGSPRNFKVTLPEDLPIAELHLKGRP